METLALILLTISGLMVLGTIFVLVPMAIRDGFKRR